MKKNDLFFSNLLFGDSVDNSSEAKGRYNCDWVQLSGEESCKAPEPHVYLCRLYDIDYLYEMAVTPFDKAVLAIQNWKSLVRYGSCAVSIERAYFGACTDDYMYLALISPCAVSERTIQELYPDITIEYSGVSVEMAHMYINRQGIFRDNSTTMVVHALYDSEIYAIWQPAYFTNDSASFAEQYTRYTREKQDQLDRENETPF